eukprot:UN06977
MSTLSSQNALRCTLHEWSCAWCWSWICWSSFCKRIKIGFTRKFKKLHPQKLLRNPTAVNAAILFGTMNFIYKVCLCFLRRGLEKDNPLVKGIAGYVSGLCLFLLPKDSRRSFALYMLVRALADYNNYRRTLREEDLRDIQLYNERVSYVRNKELNGGGNPITEGSKTLVSLKQGQRHKYPKRQHPGGYTADVAAFTIIQIPIMYAFVKAPQALSPGYFKWILWMGDLQHWKLNSTWAAPSWIDCGKGHMHMGPSCLKSHTYDLIPACFRGMSVYLPVHVIPALIFSPGRILSAPYIFVLRTIVRLIRSVIFIVLYQYFMKMTMCWGRNILHSEPRN